MSRRNDMAGPDVPAPDPVPPVGTPNPQPGDPKPDTPPPDDDDERRIVPVGLPGKPHAPERVNPRGRADVSRA